MFKNTCKCFQNLCLKTQLHTYMQHQNTTNQHQSQSLFSIMKQFVSLFKFKWLKLLNTQHLAFYAQVYNHIILVGKPQVLLVILYGNRGSFLSFSMANNYPTITSTLTSVDFRLDDTWSVFSPLALELSKWRQWLVKVVWG